VFELTSLEEAKRQSWDVILVGSSFASMFFLRGLPQNLRVLIIEKGPRIEPRTETGVYGQEKFSQDNSSEHEKEWVANSKFGGNSNCWWGQVPRFHPNDFKLASLYGVGQDWPLGYNDLEPYYVEVEQTMEVAGGGREHIFPSSAPYPFPAHTGSLTDKLLWQERPAEWVPVATARSNGGSRAKCCANGVCQSCPIDSKFTIRNGINYFMRDGVFLLSSAEVRAVELENQPAKGVIVRTPDGHDHAIAADLVALGANAIFNALIMLRSGLENDALGRYLHEQTSINLELDIAVPNYYGGSSITGHGYGLYDGAHRRESGAVLVENFNSPAAFRSEYKRWTHRLRCKLIAEDLPLYENQVALSEDDTAHIIWTGHSDYAKAGLKRAEEQLPEQLPFKIENVVSRYQPATESHIQGTHRMGTNPSTSVVDATLKTHDVPNLLALGAGVFPTCSAANPTLTLAALSLYAGRQV
jgi:choline dehydrogenase-like flavoprotein